MVFISAQSDWSGNGSARTRADAVWHHGSGPSLVTHIIDENTPLALRFGQCRGEVVGVRLCDCSGEPVRKVLHCRPFCLRGERCDHMERRPDIIVSDVRLLTGTGPDAVTSIRLRVGRVPAFFINGNPEALDGYDHDGVQGKPFESDPLKQQVERLAVGC